MACDSAVGSYAFCFQMNRKQRKQAGFAVRLLPVAQGDQEGRKALLCWFMDAKAWSPGLQRMKAEPNLPQILATLYKKNIYHFIYIAGVKSHWPARLLAT